MLEKKNKIENVCHEANAKQITDKKSAHIL